MLVASIPQSIWHLCHDICVLCDIHDVFMLHGQVPHSEGCCCSAVGWLMSPLYREALWFPDITALRTKEGGRWMVPQSSAGLSVHWWNSWFWLKKFQLPVWHTLWQISEGSLLALLKELIRGETVTQKNYFTMFPKISTCPRALGRIFKSQLQEPCELEANISSDSISIFSFEAKCLKTQSRNILKFH